MNKPKQGKIDVSNDNRAIIYPDENGVMELKVDVENDTIWATQEQISKLFDCERSVITKHLVNIIKDCELEEDSICADFAHMGTNDREYHVKRYNLDAIIAVGYRVNSKKATHFRIWATKVLHEYLVDRYSLNQINIIKPPETIQGLREAIGLLESKKNPGKLKGKLTLKLTKNLEPI